VTGAHNDRRELLKMLKAIEARSHNEELAPGNLKNTRPA
jgi:hypothetical protein